MTGTPPSGVSASGSLARWRRRARGSARRPLGHEKRETPFLNDLPTLIDELALLHHNAPLAHRSLEGRAGSAVNRIAHAEWRHDLPLDAQEGEHGQGRLGRPPAQPGGQAQGENRRYLVGIVEGLLSDASIERHVSLGDGDCGRHQLAVHHDILEVEALGPGHRAGPYPRDDGRRSTITSVSPSWTTSPRWFRSLRSSVMSPRSGLSASFLAATVATTRMVSPILMGFLNLQRSPASATAAKDWVARAKRPDWIVSPSKPCAIRSPKMDCFMNSASVWRML